MHIKPISFIALVSEPYFKAITCSVKGKISTCEFSIHHLWFNAITNYIHNNITLSDDTLPCAFEIKIKKYITSNICAMNFLRFDGKICVFSFRWLWFLRNPKQVRLDVGLVFWQNKTVGILDVLKHLSFEKIQSVMVTFSNLTFHLPKQTFKYHSVWESGNWWHIIIFWPWIYSIHLGNKWTAILIYTEASVM